MKKTTLLLLIVPLILSCSNEKTRGTNPQAGIVSAEEIQNMLAAIPERPSVRPLKKRKLLVFSIAWKYKHDTIPWGKKLVQLMAEKTGAFEAVFSDDISIFEPQNLKQFDAVFFNNTNNEIFLPENFTELSSDEQKKAAERDEKLKRSFVDFLKNGKGLAVIHAGVASFRNWPEYGNIIGARFDNHPWVSGSTVTFKIEEPNHPLMRAFDSEVFSITDEIYQMKAPYSRDNLRVLMSIDTGKTDMTKKGIHRTDGDFAMSWVKSYGKGRIFYNAFGHEKHIFWNPKIVQHWLDGIQFVLGDLQANTSPSGKTK